MKKRFTEEQITYAMRQHESGAAVAEICRTMGISEPTFYNWKKKYAGMGVTELRKMKGLEQENSKSRNSWPTCRLISISCKR